MASNAPTSAPNSHLPSRICRQLSQESAFACDSRPLTPPNSIDAQTSRDHSFNNAKLSLGDVWCGVVRLRVYVSRIVSFCSYNLFPPTNFFTFSGFRQILRTKIFGFPRSSLRFLRLLRFSFKEFFLFLRWKAINVQRHSRITDSWLAGKPVGAP